MIGASGKGSSEGSQLPYLRRPVLAPIPSKLIAAQNATVRRARNSSAPLLFLDTSAAGVPEVLIARNQPGRGRKCEIAKNLDFLLEMAKGRYGKTLVCRRGAGNRFSVMFCCCHKVLGGSASSFALYEPQAKRITVKLVT